MSQNAPLAGSIEAAADLMSKHQWQRQTLARLVGDVPLNGALVASSEARIWRLITGASLEKGGNACADVGQTGGAPTHRSGTGSGYIQPDAAQHKRRRAAVAGQWW